MPDLNALKAAVSERTAGLFITNPEDTGSTTPTSTPTWTRSTPVGGLCAYDQANANAVLGIARARECGFDLCHFNLHKTFSAPHGCMGPALGALGATAALEPYLPVPRVVLRDGNYALDEGPAPEHRPGSVRFWATWPWRLKAYAWILQHGFEGLREVALCSVLNSNYLEAQVRKIPE